VIPRRHLDDVWTSVPNLLQERGLSAVCHDNRAGTTGEGGTDLSSGHVRFEDEHGHPQLKNGNHHLSALTGWRR
jgi:hypothetical protein